VAAEFGRLRSGSDRRAWATRTPPAPVIWLDFQVVLNLMPIRGCTLIGALPVRKLCLKIEA
jgi:hypothetical protein